MSGAIQAWQRALAAEHAAVFGYDVLGPRLDPGGQQQARNDGAAHAASRDATIAALVAAGQVPVGPLPDYPLPFTVASPRAARALAVRLEEGTAAAWRYLVAADADHRNPSELSRTQLMTVRDGAVRELRASAVRAVRWRRLVSPNAPTVPFPGI
ncbi:MAG: ferritin-like domain-containing protein [Actinomycetota bacterium]